VFGIFLVPAGSAGLTVEPLDMLAGGSYPPCRVHLERVRVGPEAVLGGSERLGSAWGTLRLTGSYERLVVAALALGLASAIVERSIAFARERTQFGQPIARFQAIQHSLVEMKTGQTAMRLFVEHALAALDTGGDATQAVRMAKYLCAEQLQQIAAQGMRIMGGRAYFGFEDMARYYRESPYCLYAGGTVEIQKMLIARTMGLA
jgi:alkylation response protein AidB-like acyl-CoA dehydrogenase